jgi:hypothetical protein
MSSCCSRPDTKVGYNQTIDRGVAQLVVRIAGGNPQGDVANKLSLFWPTRGVAERDRTAGVRVASGRPQGSQLFKTCFERCCDGVAEGDREVHGPV